MGLRPGTPDNAPADRRGRARGPHCGRPVTTATASCSPRSRPSSWRRCWRVASRPDPLLLGLRAGSLRASAAPVASSTLNATSGGRIMISLNGRDSRGAAGDARGRARGLDIPRTARRGRGGRRRGGSAERLGVVRASAAGRARRGAHRDAGRMIAAMSGTPPARARTAPPRATAPRRAGRREALTIAGRTLHSRLLLGTGGFPSLELLSAGDRRQRLASS